MNATDSPHSGYTVTGLSSTEAAARLARDGANELPGELKKSFVATCVSVATEPMFLLLIAASAIYVLLGDLREAIVLSTSIAVIVVITLVQERRTENTLARLRDLSSPRALVIRDGVEVRIAGKDVVVGDVLLLREGDRVAADCEISSATMLSVDESILTGESLPVDKSPGEAAYSATLVTRGFGRARVTAIGAASRIGRIGATLSALDRETSPLLLEIKRTVRSVATGGLLLCATIALVYGASRNDYLSGALAGITVAMAVLPEEIPVVLTIFLAMGAWRMARRGVLTRRMPAIESIGAVTVLAVDKTGTLTENRMRVAVLETVNAMVDLRTDAFELDDDAQRVLATALAASERNPFDPMERAIHEMSRASIPRLAADLERADLVREYDLSADLLAVTHVWRHDARSVLKVAVKGAPETVFDLCKPDAAIRKRFHDRALELAHSGLRVLAVAEGEHSGDLPDSPRAFALRLLGLICLADPLRENVPASLAECADAGIRVLMITGDHPGTAMAIADQAGLATRGGFLTGAQLLAMSPTELAAAVREVNVYARTTPEQKLALIDALKANGEVVAMTGDGVNDAPALKSAHIGVAMGKRGSDVAREAAAIVLLDDDFSTLVAAMRMGRRIYGNIRHAMSFIVAVHVPIAAMGLFPVLFGWPLLLLPLHVMFLEFVIDPACSFVFEADPESPEAMRRKPRLLTDRLFSRPLIGRSLALGGAVMIACLSTYGLALSFASEDEARTLAFVLLVAASLSLIFVSRSSTATLGKLFVKPNPVFWWMTGTTIVLLTVSIFTPPLAEAFKFSATDPFRLAIAATVGALTVIAVGSLKALRGSIQH